MSRVPGRGSRADNRGQPTMERRKFIIGAGALATGSAAAVGTGAFSTMTSGERTVNVNVASDAEAYVALNPNSDYAEYSEDGQLELSFDDSPGTQGGADGGINPDSTYTFSDVFEIATQHQQGDTFFYIELSNFGDVDVELSEGSTEAVEGGEDLTDSDNLVKLFEPDSVTVDITLTAPDSDIGEVDGNMTLHAATGGDRSEL